MGVRRHTALFQFYRKHRSGRQLLLLKLIIAYCMARNIVLDTLRLRRAPRPELRRRIKEDLTIWRRVLREQWRA
jgi:hypothetical protein